MENFKKLFVFFLTTGIFLSVVFFVSENKELDVENDLINISKLSEEFMQDYFDNMNSMALNDDKDNVLIITSKEEIDEVYGASKVIEGPNNQYFVQYETKEDKNNALVRLKEDDSLVSVDENIIYRIEETSYNSWGVEQMYLDYATSIVNSKKLNEVTVAVIDTGCDVELFNKYYNGKIIDMYNVLEESSEVMSDEHGHGTHVAGTIAESTPDNIKILPIKVSETGNIHLSDIISAINYITYYDKADVINMSFGTYGYSESMEIAIEAANQKNIISVAAAGNNNTLRTHYPSGFDNTISIASVDSKLNKSSFSNYGSTIDFTAPGTDIKSIMGSETSLSKTNGNNDDDDHETISGTSMATPHAASAVAILKSYNKNLTLDNTMELLKKHAVDLGDKGWDRYYGHGLISFGGASFCDGTSCDEYGVFMEEGTSIQKMEVHLARATARNYGSLYNILATQVRLYYSDDYYETKYLWELDDAKITGYDPNNIEQQTVKIEYANFVTEFVIDHADERELGWEYVVIDDNSIELTGYLDNRLDIGVLYIPETLDGYNVVSIADNNSFIQSKVFGNSMDSSAFEKIILPKTMVTIGRAGLYGMNIKELIVQADGISLGDYALWGADELEKVDGVINSLGEHTFEECKMLNNITLSEDITSIPNSSFYNCYNLENINVPTKITTIGSNAFGNTKIKSFVIPEGVTTIGQGAFLNCDSLESIVIPSTVTTIGNMAFSYTGLKELYIPKSVTTIGTNAFSSISSLVSIKVDSENPIYDSRDNSNAIIETSTNTLILGIGTTKIPSSVKIIGEASFYQNLSVYEIIIPNGVEEIQESAFFGCDYLEKIIIPRSVTTISEGAIESYSRVNNNGPAIIYKTIWTYSDAYAKTYASENEINYETFNPSYIFVSVSKNDYEVFDKVNVDEDIKMVRLYYDRAYHTDTSTYIEYLGIRNVNYEEIPDGYTIKYMNDKDSFSYGDTYYTITGVNGYGETYEKQVEVTISKATPEYVVPTGLTALLGQSLSEVFLPDGFEWIDGTQILGLLGEQGYKAKYTPIDTDNYTVVDNIDITINVTTTKTILTPIIEIKDKIYDGTTDIDLDSINISNIDSNLYTIESAVVSSADIGTRNVTLKLKLTDEAFENYIFDSSSQEIECNIDITVLPLKIIKPTLTEKIYRYEGFNQSLEYNNYDNNFMWVSHVSYGEEVGDEIKEKIFLRNKNYVWEDGTTDELVFTAVVEKALVVYEYEASDNIVSYDGEKHGINLTIYKPTSAKVLYKDENGKYTLTEMPTYKEVGTYVIKYRIFINDNYEDVYGENTLTIRDSSSLNLSTDYEGVYDGEKHTFNLNINLDEYTISYSIGNTNYDLNEIPKFIDVGEYVVNYKVMYGDNKELLGSNKVIIYGIEKIDESLLIKDEILVITDQENRLSEISKRIDIYSKNSSIVHYDKNNNIVNTGVLRTGDKLVININNMNNIEYNISILGDVTSDGIVNIADVIKIADHTINKNVLVYEYEKIASDVTGDNIINIADVVKIADYTLDNSIKLWR